MLESDLNWRVKLFFPEKVDGGTVYYVNSDGTVRVYKTLNNWAGENYQGAGSSLVPMQYKPRRLALMEE